MDSVGRMLREAREARGMTLEDVARATRIPLTSLQRVEEDALDELPAPVYARGFVRAYAKTVGLDPAEAMSLLGPLEGPQGHPVEPAADQPVEEGETETGHYGVVLARASGRRRGRVSWTHVLLVLLAAGMVVAGWLMVGRRGLVGGGAEESSPSSTVPGSGTTAPDAADDEDAGGSTGEPGGTRPADGPSAPDGPTR